MLNNYFIIHLHGLIKIPPPSLGHSFYLLHKSLTTYYVCLFFMVFSIICFFFLSYFLSFPLTTKKKKSLTGIPVSPARFYQSKRMEGRREGGKEEQNNLKKLNSIVILKFEVIFDHWTPP